MAFRPDGLDNPCSPNSYSTTWRDVERLANESEAVVSWDYDGNDMVIEWCDGNTSRFSEPTSALNDIHAMSAS